MKPRNGGPLQNGFGWKTTDSKPIQIIRKTNQIDLRNSLRLSYFGTTLVVHELSPTSPMEALRLGGEKEKTSEINGEKEKAERNKNTDTTETYDDVNVCSSTTRNTAWPQAKENLNS